MRPPRSVWYYAVVLAACCTLLGSCGQRGALYLPEPADTVVPAEPEPASDGQDEDDEDS